MWSTWCFFFLWWKNFFSTVQKDVVRALTVFWTFLCLRFWACKVFAQLQNWLAEWHSFLWTQPKTKRHAFFFQQARRITRLAMGHLMIDAKTLVVFGLTVSSILGLEPLTCNFSWPSTFSFKYLLKSKRLGRCQLRLTVCVDQACFDFVGSLPTAWFRRVTLLRSSWDDINWKSATSLETAQEKLKTFSELCILRGRKLAYPNESQIQNEADQIFYAM